MSVFFCFSLPSAIGIYWVVQGAFQLVQQLIVNAHMNKIDVDDLIRRNVEKNEQEESEKRSAAGQCQREGKREFKGAAAREDAESKAKEDKISRNKSRWRRLKHFTIPIRSGQSGFQGKDGAEVQR